MAHSKPKYLLIEGVNFPNEPLVKPDVNFPEDLKRFQPRKDDVFVCSYPKSGTNWLCEILWQIYHNGAISNVNIGERVYWFDVHPLFRMPEGNEHDSPSNPKPVLELLPSPRLMRTHLPYHVTPKGQDETTRCKYIYIARNVKDVVVSFHQFYQAMITTKGHNISLEAMTQDILTGDVPYNKWTDHVLGWWKHKDDSNVLFLKYEDMNKDLSSAVRTIAEFLQKPLTEEVIQGIVHQCSFAEMAKNPDTYLVFPGADEASYLRKGIVGDWKNHLSSEMKKKLEEECLAEVKAHGLEFE